MPSLNGVTYKYCMEEFTEKSGSYRLIAQEWQKVMSEAVREDGYLAVNDPVQHRTPFCYMSIVDRA